MSRPSPLALALLVACADAPRSPAGRAPLDPAAAFRAQLGRTWELARLGDREIPAPAPGTPPDSAGRDLVPGRRPTLFFSADPPRVGGRTFCNGYGGPYTVRGDSIHIPEIVSTAVGCDGLDSLETRMHRGLRGARRFEIDSTRLVLVGEDGTRLTFVPARP